MAFGERLTVAMARKRMNMRGMARLCKVTPQAVFKWMRGASMPSSQNFMIICSNLDCSHEWLMCVDPLDFHSTERAPDGRHAKYWVREAIAELKESGEFYKYGNGDDA